MKKSFKKITAALVAMAAATTFATAPLSNIGATFELPNELPSINIVTEGESLVFEGYTYTTSESGVTITSYSGEETELVIPSEIDGKAVIAISNSAFAKNTAITSVTIPSSVKTIGKSAFAGCTGLTEVEIPSSVTVLGSYAFEDCAKLEKVTLNEGLVTIGNRAFGSTKISSVYIPTTLKNVEMESMNYTGPFYNCASLNDIEFGAGITAISDYLFYYCNGITEIEIPDTVTTIGKRAFGSCPSLKNVEISSSVKTIGIGAFEECGNITEVEIPSNVTVLGSYAFEDCTKLEKVTLNEGLVTIGDRAFGNTKITSVYIPDTLTNVEMNYMYYHGPFFNCSALSEVTFGKNRVIIPRYLFEGCTGLKEITIPKTVVKIDNSAFCDCLSLDKITIMNGYATIYNNAYTIAPNATIYGYDDSTANIYATKYNREFVSIGELPVSYLGDVDRNGLVDSSDASLILAEYALLSTNGELTFDEDQTKRADITGDGSVDAVDASFVLQYYAFTATAGPLISDDYFTYLCNF